MSSAMKGIKWWTLNPHPHDEEDAGQPVAAPFTRFLPDCCPNCWWKLHAGCLGLEYFYTAKIMQSSDGWIHDQIVSPFLDIVNQYMRMFAKLINTLSSRPYFMVGFFEKWILMLLVCSFKWTLPSLSSSLSTDPLISISQTSRLILMRSDGLAHHDNLDSIIVKRWLILSIHAQSPFKTNATQLMQRYQKSWQSWLSWVTTLWMELAAVAECKQFIKVIAKVRIGGILGLAETDPIRLFVRDSSQAQIATGHTE